MISELIKGYPLRTAVFMVRPVLKFLDVLTDSSVHGKLGNVHRIGLPILIAKRKLNRTGVK